MHSHSKSEKKVKHDWVGNIAVFSTIAVAMIWSTCGQFQQIPVSWVPRWLPTPGPNPLRSLVSKVTERTPRTMGLRGRTWLKFGVLIGGLFSKYQLVVFVVSVILVVPRNTEFAAF